MLSSCTSRAGVQGSLERGQVKPAIGETQSSRKCAGVRRAALLLMATIALVTVGVSIAQAQWPTTCVELNDLAEAAVGAHQNVGIYQRAYGDQAEAQCQSDHRDEIPALASARTENRAYAGGDCDYAGVRLIRDGATLSTT